MNVFVDSIQSDDKRRAELFHGGIFLYSPGAGALKLCNFGRELVQASFHPHDPLTVHKHIAVEECVALLAKLKPEFIHHQTSKELVRNILTERGCDLEKTYFDVPRLRTAFPSDYLSSGIAYAFHPHRDTWYSAPFAQINWWIPVYEFTPENGLAFHPQFWDEPIRNNSETYNYYEWNRKGRQSATSQIKQDTRVQPRPQQVLTPDPKVNLVVNVGGAILFSAAQLHSTVPNVTGATRYSIDFRTVNLDDLQNRQGAPNIDSACTGTTLRDYIRASDFTPLPEGVVALYFDGTEADFTPSPSEAPARA